MVITREDLRRSEFVLQCREIANKWLQLSKILAVEKNLTLRCKCHAILGVFIGFQSYGLPEHELRQKDLLRRWEWILTKYWAKAQRRVQPREQLVMPDAEIPSSFS